MMIPNVSVIIPTYKRPATLLRTIDSLQNQTWSNFDIIVVDNAADPDLERRIVRFNATARTPDRKLWQRKLLTGYVPDALVYHHVPAERMTIEFFRRRMANEGTADIYTLYHGSAPTRVRLFRHAAGVTARNSRSWMKARVCRGRTDKPSVHVQIDAARTQSQLRNVLRLIIDSDRRALVARRDWLDSQCASER